MLLAYIREFLTHFFTEKEEKAGRFYFIGKFFLVIGFSCYHSIKGFVCDFSYFLKFSGIYALIL